MTKSKSNTTLYLLIVLGIVVVVAVAYALSLFGILSVKVEKPSGQSNGTTEEVALPPKATPTPTKLYPDNKNSGTYNISQASGTPGPKITSLTLDPLDPKLHEKQIIRTHLSYTSPVTSAIVTYTSDNKERTIPLTRISGSSNNGDWQAEWTVDDTVLYTYHVIVKATADDGTTNATGAQPR